MPEDEGLSSSVMSTHVERIFDASTAGRDEDFLDEVKYMSSSSCAIIEMEQNAANAVSIKSLFFIIASLFLCFRDFAMFIMPFCGILIN